VPSGEMETSSMPEVRDNNDSSQYLIELVYLPSVK
jgi:hypothetical protein